MQLLYTIIFCLKDDQILMLHRSREPNKNLQNGLGGKINLGLETPTQSIARELMEESGIDLQKATSVRFSGVVTWEVEGIKEINGMYAYLAIFRKNITSWEEQDTDEGHLSWQLLSKILDKNNTSVVSNIPKSLSKMLKTTIPKHYHLYYTADHILKKMTTAKLSPKILSSINEK